MVEREHIECIAEEAIGGLEARMADRSLLPFEKDYLFVRDLLSRLTAKGYVGAVAALDQLVPRWNPDGTRQIADKRINRKLEALIASRYLAPEISLLGQEGVWSGVPLDVRAEIQKSGNVQIILEMTNKCTVMCDFCGLADKGEIAEKVDFNSVVEITYGYYADGERGGIYESCIPLDHYYWGSDPFDTRWFRKSTGVDLDYGDILERHAEICGKRRVVYTSTAIPIGEELRVLRAFLWYLQARKDGKIGNVSTFRFSTTDINEHRLRQILTVAESLYGTDQKQFGVVISRNRNENSFLAGNGALKPKEFTPSDVIGVNCMDSLVVTLEGLQCFIMEGTSTEMTRGEARWQARSVMDPDGTVRYEIPKYYHKPDMLNGDPKSFFPDVEIKTVTVHPGKKTLVRHRTLINDPHRSLLRLAAVAYHYFRSQGKYKWNPNSLSVLQKQRINGLVARDIEIVREHLEVNVWGQKKTNPMMEGIHHALVKALKG